MTRKQRSNAVLGCISAMVGAGFASGREIVSFFSRFGAISYIGIVFAALAAAVIAYALMHMAFLTRGLTLAMICEKTLGKAAKLGTAAFFLLLAVTGGCMLSAAGELVRLVAPIHFAYELGLGLTLIMGVMLIRKDLSALFKCGKFLLPVMVIAYVLCAFLKGEGQLPPPDNAWLAIPNALAYGALNVVLCAPVLCEVGIDTLKKERKQIALLIGAVFLMLILLANGVMLMHPDMQTQALPMVQLLRNYGLFGFYLSALMMYLAVFTTFITAARGIYMMVHSSIPLTVLPLICFALLGFSGLVSFCYPILGYVCALLVGMWFVPFIHKG